MFKVWFEDISIGDVEEFGSCMVSREEIVEFATKYDPQPFHINEDLAKQSVFGDLCASGWHTGAMTMRMMVDNMMEKGFAGMGSPGLDTLQWKKPVFPGDTLSVRSTTTGKRDSASRPNIGFIASETEVLNQHGDVVMLMQANVMVLKKKPG